MKYTIVLIDDDPVVLAQQGAKFAKFPWAIVIGSFTSIAEAYQFLSKRRGKVDIICCDIDMPGINGIDGVAIVMNRTRLFVFLTGYPEFALPAYDKRADMYLLKPLTEIMVLEILGKLEGRHGYNGLPEAPTGSFLVTGLRTEQLVNVEVRDITKISANDHFVEVYAPHLIGIAHMGMDEITAYFAPTDWFIRLNRSTVVALSFIASAEKGYLYTKDGEKYPIGDVYGPQVREFLKRNQLRKGRG